MIKLNITMGNSFFEHYYLPFSEEYGEIFTKIAQHKIVLSERLMNYYKECADSLGRKMICATYLQNIISCGKRCTFVHDFEKDTIEEELFAIAGEQKMKLLLAEKDEIKKAPKGINLYRSDELRENDNCVLNLYSLPVTARYVPPKKGVAGYKKWMQNWIQGEKKVIIRDKYALTKEGILALKKHYLPLFDSGMNIEIQVDGDVSEDILNQLDTAEFAGFCVHVYKCEKMHERVLIFSNFQIVIGKGMSFMSGDWDLTGESFISISKITIDSESTKIKQLR